MWMSDFHVSALRARLPGRPKQSNKELSQAQHLFASAKSNQFWRNGALHTADHCPQITRENHGTADNEWLLGDLVDRPKKLPQRMPAQRIVKLAIGKFSQQLTAFSRPHLAMVFAEFLREGPGLPALHPGIKDRNMINSSSLYCNVTADFLEAFAPKQLAGARYMFNTYKAVIVTHGTFLERRPGQTQARVIGEL